VQYLVHFVDPVSLCCPVYPVGSDPVQPIFDLN
jgi:hypothetical protein